MADEQRVSPYVEPSIVFVGGEWTASIWDSKFDEYVGGKNKTFSIPIHCTGYVVGEAGWIATAGHCVRPDDDIHTGLKAVAAQWALSNKWYGDASQDAVVDHLTRYWDLDAEVGEDSAADHAARNVEVSWGTSVSGQDSSDGKAARVIQFQKKLEAGDGAILRINETGLNALPLDASVTAETGEPVAAIGYPASVDNVTEVDYTPSIKTGTISSVKEMKGGLVTVYEINAEIDGGMSGGPMVNMSGEVVGTNSFGLLDENGEEKDQGFSFVHQSARIAELMGSSGATNTLTDTTKTYRAGINAYFEGDKALAVASLEKVVAEQPGNGVAQRYLEKAKEMPDPPPPDEGVASWVWWLLGRRGRPGGARGSSGGCAARSQET